jgi:hypothetical protein
MHGAGRNPNGFTQQGRESRSVRVERKNKIAELREIEKIFLFGLSTRVKASFK